MSKMKTINIRNIEAKGNYYIWTIPKCFNFAGYKTVIPKGFVFGKNFSRYINLSDEQKLKLKKDKETVIIRFKDLIK